MMNSIEALEDRIKRQFSEAITAMDPHPNPEGSWFLDVTLGDYDLVVEWIRGVGFGITNRPDVEYGERADEYYPDLESATQRSFELLSTRGYTKRPNTANRVSHGKSADSVHLKQLPVLRFERRNDPRLSTLRSMISAMGGTLIVKAAFPDGTERELNFTKPSKKK